jgi:hypothetical protein
MEHLWSPAGATSGNRWQMGHHQKSLKQADPQPVATHGNRFGAHGKEGIDRRPIAQVGLESPDSFVHLTLYSAQAEVAKSATAQGRRNEQRFMRWRPAESFADSSD